MICKNCETENPENAVYCKNCGKRLDGKQICPSCGKENPGDAKVCTMCGTRIVAEDGAPAKQKTAGSWKKWVELAGGISAMVAVFCVLLCTFLTGVSASYQGYTVAGNDIWYYFGDVWKELKELGDASTMLQADMYMNAVIGLLVSIGTIVSVLTFAILAAVRFGMKTAGKSDKDYFRYALNAVLAFICGAALLVTINSTSAEGLTAVMNKAGLAGTILGIIFLCGSIGCRIAVKGKELATKQSIMQLAFTAGALVLLSIAVAFATKPACIMKGEDAEGKVNFFAWAGSLAVYAEHINGPGTPFALSIIAMLLQIVVVILGMAVIGYRIKNLVTNEPKSGLGSAIALTVVSAVFLAFAVSALAVSADKLEMESGFNYAYIIVEFVFAALSIAVAAVYAGLSKQKKNN